MSFRNEEFVRLLLPPGGASMIGSQTWLYGYDDKTMPVKWIKKWSNIKQTNYHGYKRNDHDRILLLDCTLFNWHNANLRPAGILSHAYQDLLKPSFART